MPALIPLLLLIALGCVIASFWKPSPPFLQVSVLLIIIVLILGAWPK